MGKDAGGGGLPEGDGAPAVGCHRGQMQLTKKEMDRGPLVSGSAGEGNGVEEGMDGEAIGFPTLWIAKWLAKYIAS